MASLSTLKPFLPLLLTFFGPRALSYYRTIKTAYRTRPPARPLKADTSRALNVLFFSICIFFFLSLPVSRNSSERNVFTATNSRLHIPTDVLFSRLALLRLNGILLSFDEDLKTKILTPTSRLLYLKYGPSTILNCSFCTPEDPSSYLLYHLPTNILLPHLLHLLLLGLATSAPLTGLEAAWWRFRLTVGALALAALDIYLTSTFNPRIDGNIPSPTGMFWVARLIRPLAICVFDCVSAFLIYASATNRFLLFRSPADTDTEIIRHRQDQVFTQTTVALQMAHTRLRAYSIVKSAVVRDPGLKAVDDHYWGEVGRMEGTGSRESVWDEEEVQAAIARAYGSGALDAAQIGKEADMFVGHVTKSLELRDSRQD